MNDKQRKEILDVIILVDDSPILGDVAPCKQILSNDPRVIAWLESIGIKTENVFRVSIEFVYDEPVYACVFVRIPDTIVSESVFFDMVERNENEGAQKQVEHR